MRISKALYLIFIAGSAWGQVSQATRAEIDKIAEKVLSDTGAPSASIAVARGGETYAKAYGKARLNPDISATTSMRYKIASNSKQLAATAILLLQEERKLKLDDPVSKYVPGLTRGNEVTIRELLSHTSGYQDYYPLDYVAPFMAHDVTPQEILTKWAKIPLDFEPGTKWQYSNTNYVIVGQIIEKLTGKPMFEFIKARILDKLGMASAVDASSKNLGADDPAGFAQFALAGPHLSPPEGNGWMYAAGELAMTPSDLAKWDASLIAGTILKPESMRELTREVQLKSGTGTRYALGLDVSLLANGHRKWSHSGGASGYVSLNSTYPDDRASITVLTNAEGPAAAQIARKIQDLLFSDEADPGATAALDNAKKLFAGLQKGQLERNLISDDLADYLSPAAVKDFAASLGPLGDPESFDQDSHEGRGGMEYRSFIVRMKTKSVRISTFVTKEGKYAQFLVTPR